ncbi:hypothetical protein Ccrd_011815, partial [Cynara cardunculus var. scolymus]
MMKGSRTTVLTFAEKCKTILASNWQGNLNTVKADAKGSSTSHGENLQELLDEDQQYMSYKFDISSITYIEGKGSSHEVDLKDMEESKADPLSLFSASLIDGINQSEARRRALMILCATYLNKNVKWWFPLIGKGWTFKVVGPMTDVGSRECEWKELRLVLTEEAGDVETFCRRL